MKHRGQCGVLVTGLLAMLLFVETTAAQGAQERGWGSQAPASTYLATPVRPGERYNPWEKLTGESDSRLPEQPRYLERPRRAFQPEAQPAYPPPAEYRAPVPMVMPFGVQPVYPQAGPYSPYPGIGGYPGILHYSPYGGGVPIPGVMPWGFLPW